jgi:hypothetical protein
MTKYIQRKRTKGWSLDKECQKLGIKRKDVVFCGRGSKWGNPFKKGQFIQMTNYGNSAIVFEDKMFDKEMIMKTFKLLTDNKHLRDFRNITLNKINPKYICFPNNEEIKKELKGKTLMCWCSKEDFDNDLCHCSVLYKIANGE